MCDFHGLIRLYLPIRSSSSATNKSSIVVPVKPCTRLGELRQKLHIPALFLQLGLQHIRPLSDDCLPLNIQLDILTALGYETLEERLLIGHSPSLQHIFTFFIANPHPSSLSSSSSPSSSKWSPSASSPSSSPVESHHHCRLLVRQHNLFLNRHWQSRRCSIRNGCPIIWIGPASEGELEEQLHTAFYAVEECAGQMMLKLVPKSAAATTTTKLAEWHFLFGDMAQLREWKKRVEKARLTAPEDLSNRQLLFLPADLFILARHRLIICLNLRRNSLQCRPLSPQILGGPPSATNPGVGWLDDIAPAFPSLRQLNLADNRLHKLPVGLLMLTALTELDLSGNRLTAIPVNIRLLANLTSLKLSNNWLLQLPPSLAKCVALKHLELDFNRFTEIPKVLFQIANLSSWSLAGNRIEALAFPPARKMLARPSKINLRLNPLTVATIRLTHQPLCSSLTGLDLRDSGSKMTGLELDSLTRLECLHCERNRIRKLALNGSALRELFATENELDSLTIVPLPRHLCILKLGHNQLATLPEWVIDLPELIQLEVQNNRLAKLPARIFISIPSLRHLNAAHNRLDHLPEVLQRCQLESLLLNGNRLAALPTDLFQFASKLRYLNCAQNRLDHLGSALSQPSASIRLKELRLSHNRLSAKCLLPILGQFRHLRLLDLAHNRCRSLPPSLANLQLLEELNLSANRLQSLPSSLFRLPRLHTLKAHSNLICTFPAQMNRANSLKLLDLSSNKLQEMPTNAVLPPLLEHLDLTCNRLAANKRNEKFKFHGSQLIDFDRRNFGRNFCFGFSQSRGQRQHLCIRQCFLTTAASTTFFALIDGGNNGEIADLVHDHLEHVLGATENVAMVEDDIESASFAKLALLRVLERLGEKGRHLGAAVLLLGLCPSANGHRRRLFCANSGHCSALLLRHCPLQPIWIAAEMKSPKGDAAEMERLRAANAILTDDGWVNGVTPCGHAIGHTAMFPAILPMIATFCAQTTPECHSIVIANRHVWTSLEANQIERLVKDSRSAQQAAKNIQDAVQANNCEENLSIIVIGLGAEWSAESHFPV